MHLGQYGVYCTTGNHDDTTTRQHNTEHSAVSAMRNHCANRYTYINEPGFIQQTQTITELK
jgi:hypothetical protein